MERCSPKKTLKKYLAPVFYEELVLAENEPDIFKKLNLPPDEVRGAIRIYNMKPKNDTNFANPLDILYIAAEGTFLRRLEQEPCVSGIRLCPCGKALQ